MTTTYNFGQIGIGASVQHGRNGGFVNWNTAGTVFEFFTPDGVTPATIRVATTPTNANDAVSKSHVDAVIEGVAAKESVRASSTVNVNIATGLVTGSVHDGVTMVTGNRILLMGQTTASENGIYVIVASGAAIRASDANTNTKLGSAFTFVEEGQSRGNRGYFTTFDSNDVLGTDAVNWIQFTVNNDAQLALTKIAEPIFGFDNGVTNTEVFSSASRASQGLAVAEWNGVKTYFIFQRVAGSSLQLTEQHRICWLQAPSVTTPVPLGGFTDPIHIGHQQLSAYRVGTNVKLITQRTTTVGHVGTDAGKGFSIIDWVGNGTTAANVTDYQLFGYSGSTHKYQDFHSATPAISRDGKWLALVAQNQSGGSSDPQDNANFLFVYDFAEILAAGDPLTVDPKFFSQISQPDRGENMQYTQSVACAEGVVWIQRGYADPRGRHVLQKLDFTGNILQEIDVDDGRAAYSVDQLESDVTLGIAYTFEPEGIAIDDDGGILWLAMDYWNAINDVVTFEGGTFACTNDITASFENPRNGGYWAPTSAVSGGAWDSTTSYTTGAATRRAKVIWKIAPSTGAVGELPMSSGVTLPVSGASLYIRDNAVDLATGPDADLKFTRYSQNTKLHYDTIQYTGGRNFGIFDSRPLSDNNLRGVIGVDLSPTRQLMEIRGPGGSLATAGAINAYGIGDSTASHNLWLGAGGEWLLKLLPNIVRSETVVQSYRQALSTGNISTSPRAGFEAIWYEGTQDLGVGEGLFYGWGVQLTGDTTHEYVAKAETRKISTSDTSRTSSWNLQVSSDGTTVGLRDVLSVNPTTGRLTAPLGIEGYEHIIYHSVAPIVHTGTATKTPITTVTIPGGSIGPNGWLKVEIEVTTPDSTIDNKIVTLEYGGTVIHETALDSLDSTRNYMQIIPIYNVNSEASQYFRAVGALSPVSVSNSNGNTTATVDSSVNQDLILSFTIADTTETLNLRRLSVFAIYRP